MTEEVHRLLNRLLSGELSEAEFERLEQLMNESQEARQLYFRYVDLDAELHKTHAGQQAGEPVAELRRALDQSAPAGPRRDKRWLAPILLAAACLAGLAVIAKFFDPQPGPPTSNTGPATELVGSVLHAPERAERKAGDRIAAGLIEIGAGRLLLRLDNGALLNVEGPAKLNLVSQSRAILHHGKVTVRCPASAIGFVLEGPGLSAVDLGTEFGMSAMNGDAEFACVRGRGAVADGES